MNDAIVKCRRCGKPCRAGQSTTPNARPFKRALKGFCTECVVAAFFQDDNPEKGIGFALPPDFDPEGLRLPHLQDQFARVLRVGCSELRIDDIDWETVIRNWRLPV